jgi:hypothetical protein
MPNLKFPRFSTALGCLLVLMWAGRSWSQESRGLKFNNLTVSPFVNLEYRYDSNVNYAHDNEEDDNILRVNPGVDLSYQGDMWGLRGNAWYAYDWYKELDRLNSDSYGESLEFYRESAKGWRFVLGQKYIKSSEDDSLADGGKGLWRDRDQFDFHGALAYQFSEKTELTLSGMYSDLSYDNSQTQYYPLYGWQEWSAGLELARKLSEKSNLLLSGSYQQYTSDGATKMDDTSTGYSLQAGLGSRATERIRYHLLTGVSWFDYGNTVQEAGWTYSADASWVINKKLAASIAGSSNFQPSEREANQAVQVYVMSAGLTYQPMRLLSTRFDVAYRREEEQIDTATAGGAATDDIFSVRARADYQLMRYVTLYGGLEYEDHMSDNEVDEFDRYRATWGLNFRY